MADTLARMLLESVKSYDKPDFMLFKKDGVYVPVSSKEFCNRVRYFSLGLRTLGFSPGDKGIILSENRPEWVMTDFAFLCLGGITVPIYTSLVSEQVKYIVRDSDAKVIVFSNKEMWSKIDAVKSSLVSVQHIIGLSDAPPPGVLSVSQVVDMGKKADLENPGLFERIVGQIKSDDEASIIYTSGTTGLPKGVVLTHENFLSNSKAAALALDFTVKDTVLSFLPLSHVLERMVAFTYIYKGCSIAYAESAETVAQNLLEVRPHIMVSVPRVFEKIYAKVMDTVLAGSALKKKIFFWALKVGREFGRRKLAKEKISPGLRFRMNVAHKLVFSKIIERTGGRVRFFVSGGAPLSKDIAEFFYAMGLVIIEGYGLTETSPVIAVNTFENLKFGTVGKPVSGVAVKIAADGEILTRGPNVMKGYYKRPEETRETMEGDWLMTGDIGFLDEEGFLTITDRKKDLIITSGGKNVAPQPIENILKTNPYISSAVVVGDRRRFITALIVPNFEKLEAYAHLNAIVFADRRDLVRDERIVGFIKAETDRATPELAPYEKIKRIALLDRDFEIEKDEITPTLKVKRNIIEKKYKDVIEALYREEAGNSGA